MLRKVEPVSNVKTIRYHHFITCNVLLYCIINVRWIKRKLKIIRAKKLRQKFPVFDSTQFKIWN